MNPRVPMVVGDVVTRRCKDRRKLAHESLVAKPLPGEASNSSSSGGQGNDFDDGVAVCVDCSMGYAYRNAYARAVELSCRSGVGKHRFLKLERRFQVRFCPCEGGGCLALSASHGRAEIVVYALGHRIRCLDEPGENATRAVAVLANVLVFHVSSRLACTVLICL